MNAPTRLGLFGLALAVVFALAAVTARAVVPEETARAWAQESTTHGGEHASPTDDGTGDAAGDHSAHDDAAAPAGLALEQDGYRLTGVSAPTEVDEHGRLELTVTDADGDPVTDYSVEHEEELHLVVVRSDGQHFRHVHPQRAADGTWSLPWTWQAAGTYRLYADTTPADADEGVTLTSTVDVAGDLTPTASQPTRTTSVDGLDVSVEGDLVPGEESRLTLRVERDGEPVTTIEPYLGAAGHLVALREGDLAYLHVHPEGEAPTAAKPGGPEIDFVTTAPTPGRYLLYLDVKVDGQVHTAPLVVDTAGSSPEGSTANPSTSHGDTDHDH